MAEVTLLVVVRAMWRIRSWVKDLEGVCITYQLNYGLIVQIHSKLWGVFTLQLWDDSALINGLQRLSSCF